VVAERRLFNSSIFFIVCSAIFFAFLVLSTVFAGGARASIRFFASFVVVAARRLSLCSMISIVSSSIFLALDGPPFGHFLFLAIFFGSMVEVITAEDSRILFFCPLLLPSLE